MSKSLVDSLIDSVFDANWVGRRGEKLTERELKLVNLFGRHGKTVRNIYIPKENEETSEIDLVYITQKGIFVFESKNYSGWIFGNENDAYWITTLPNRQKNRFYNPIKQNRTHIKWLRNHVGADVPMFSVIVFSERCELKQITLESEDVKVIKRDRTYAAVRSIWDSVPDALPEDRVTELYEELKRLADVDKPTKQAHIDHIRSTYQTEDPGSSQAVMTQESSSAEPREKTCPRCGKPLVLRTAKKGANAGSQFWGCSGYPSCRYTAQVK